MAGTNPIQFLARARITMVIGGLTIVSEGWITSYNARNGCSFSFRGNGDAEPREVPYAIVTTIDFI